MKEKSKKIIESASEISGELLFDGQLSEGLLKEIPVVKTIWAGYNTGKSLQEHLYLRKLKIFLENITDINEKDYQKFLKNAEDNEESLSSSLLLILDKIEDERKAVLIANAFKFYVREKFNFKTFNRILLIINRGFCDDLLKIRSFKNADDVLCTNDDGIESESLEELFSCGLLTNAGFDGGDAFGNRGTNYALNKFGIIFLRILKEVE